MKRIAVMALLAGCGGRDVVITGGGPPQQPAHHERPVVYVDGPMYCGDGKTGVTCWLTADECNTAASACRPTIAMSCFDYTHVMLGERARACFQDIDDCEGVRGVGIADMTDVSPECAVFRTRR